MTVIDHNATGATPGEASNSTLPSLESRAYLALNPSLKTTAKSSEGFLAVALMSGKIADRQELASLIEGRLLGVKPDDQDLVLEDADWKVIIQALRRGAGESLLRRPGPLPPGCHCKPGRCMAPRVMGNQTLCRDPAKAAPKTSIDERAEHG